MKKIFVLSFSILCLSAAGIPIMTGFVNAQNPETAAEQKPSNVYEQLNLFGEAFEKIRNQYVEEITDEQLIEYAIQGMLTSLDPHSSFMNAEDFQDMRVNTRGEFGGLGIEVTMQDGLIRVIAPMDDTPAAKAGIQAGDFITHIDGDPIIGLTLSDAIEKMRGPVNSKITVTVRREGVEPFEVPIIRAVIKMRSVRSELKGESIGYIRITNFNEQTTPGLEKALNDLKAQAKPKLSGIILDLRNNPGGLLDEAVSVSDAFLEKGEIVSTRGRDSSGGQRFNAKSGDLSGGLPIVALINGGSASASEIVAGALQDHRRAIILGTKSFGKGSVQTILPLPGNVAMRLTTQRYYTPSGRSIQAKGIDPDIEVPQARVELLAQTRQRTEASLPGALANPDETETPQAASPSEGSPETSNPTGQPGESETPSGAPTPSPNGNGTAPTASAEEPAPQDYQLERAVDLLRGIAYYQASLGSN